MATKRAKKEPIVGITPTRRRAPVPQLRAGSPQPWEMFPEDYWVALRTFYLQIHDRKAESKIARDLKKYGGLPLGYAQHAMSHRHYPSVVQGLNSEKYYLAGHYDGHSPVVEVRLPDDIEVRHWWPYFDKWGTMVVEPPWYDDFDAWWRKYIAPNWPNPAPRDIEAIRQIVPFYEETSHVEAYCLEFLGPVALVYRNSRRREGIEAIYREGVIAPTHREMVKTTHWRGHATVPPEIAEIYGPCRGGSNQGCMDDGQAEIAKAMSSISRVVEMMSAEHTQRQAAELHHLAWIALRLMLHGLALISKACELDLPLFRAVRRFPVPGEQVRGLVAPHGMEEWPDELVELALGSPEWRLEPEVQQVRAAFEALQRSELPLAEVGPCWELFLKLCAAFMRLAKSVRPEVYRELQLLVRMLDH